MSLDPQYVGDILDDIRRVGKATGQDRKAEEVVSRMQERIDAVAARSALADARPRTLHLEWVDPLMCGGHWVPEMVEMAGGENCFGDKETGSFQLDWEDVVASRPEVIIFMPCGFEVKRALGGRAHPLRQGGLGLHARRAEQPGLRHRRQRLYQPLRPPPRGRAGNHR